MTVTRLLRVPLPARLLGLAMAAIVASATAAGAAAPANASPVEELQELDEIWVRGKLTANVVVDAENRFFRLYNKLNRNNRYDVYCDYMQLDRDSMIMHRACVPDFLVNYASLFTGSWSYTSVPSCGMTANSDMDGNTYYVTDCSGGAYAGARYGGSYYNGSGWNISGYPAGWSEPSYMRAGVGTPEERAEYVETVMRVTRSDPQLLAMANEMVGMWNEMDRIQARYVQVRDEKRAAKKAAKEAAKAERAARRARQREQ